MEVVEIPAVTLSTTHVANQKGNALNDFFCQLDDKRKAAKYVTIVAMPMICGTIETSAYSRFYTDVAKEMLSFNEFFPFS